jgi:hypothetical protein
MSDLGSNECFGCGHVGHRANDCPTPNSIPPHERGDEPHGSLFVHFRIFAPLADDHVIVSHVTGVTRPILTFGDQLQSFALICDDLRGVTRPILTICNHFAIIFTFGRWLALIVNPNLVLHSTAAVLQFIKTIAAHQNSCYTSAHQKAQGYVVFHLKISHHIYIPLYIHQLELSSMF